VQTIRKRILEILKERGGASVSELAEELGMAPVSVRHHLDILQGQGLVTIPRVRRRRTVGRPQQVYTLTEAAIDQFPNNFRALTSVVLDEIKEVVSPDEFKEIFQRIAQRTAEEAPPPKEGQTLEERLTEVVEFLSKKGYLPRWERSEEGDYLLHIFNCPYAGVSEAHPELCQMDATLAQLLLGITPERLCHMAAGDLRCTYRIAVRTNGRNAQA
jgi:predicted ArsR family transcriptional regulator